MKPDFFATCEVASPTTICQMCESLTTRQIRVTVVVKDRELSTHLDIPLCEDHDSVDNAIKLYVKSVKV